MSRTASVSSTRDGELEPAVLVPARMVNEVLYCERLMYLEWVQGEFADNFYTVDGRASHDRVDAREQRLEQPDDANAPRVARSVWLTSERMGVTAKIDLVESEGRVAIPVEYKRGKSPEVPDGAHLPERAQICVHVLLLREHGFEAQHGEIYFVGNRRRVKVEITPELTEATVGAIARAKELAAWAKLPPPLLADPRCNGCSLAPICLPDEVRLLRALDQDRGEPEEPVDVDEAEDSADESGRVRPLYPGRDDRVALYVHTVGAKVSLDGYRLRVTSEEDRQEARLANTSQVSIFGNVAVTTPAIRALLERDLPLCIFSGGGWYLGRTIANGSNNVELRIEQFRAATDTERSLDISRAMVNAKILNQRTILRRNQPEPSPVVLHELRLLARKAARADSAEELLGLEGTAARRYFKELPSLVRVVEIADEFSAEGRNRRPPKDPLNATLSFAYALLVKDCTLALAAAGLDPLLGFFHRPRFGRPGLALDLMEEFRPLVADSVAFTAFNTGVLGSSDFVRGNGSCGLTPPARKRLIEAYERRVDGQITHPLFSYRMSYRRLFELQARLLVRHLLGELEEYPAFRTR